MVSTVTFTTQTSRSFSNQLTDLLQTCSVNCGKPKPWTSNGAPNINTPWSQSTPKVKGELGQRCLEKVARAYNSIWKQFDIPENFCAKVTRWYTICIKRYKQGIRRVSTGKCTFTVMLDAIITYVRSRSAHFALHQHLNTNDECFKELSIWTQK